MKVYIAAAYGRIDTGEAGRWAADLRARGHEVTARWVTGFHDTPPAGIAKGSPEHLAWAAADDVEDVLAADCVVSVTGGSTRARGGRHVELGIGLATGKLMILVGERENVFHHLPEVHHYPTWAAFLAALAKE